MDEQVVRRDETIRKLSDQFINVRLVKCNHLDLSLFQIDWDLTFGVVFINADKTIYARYGTRNSMKADDDVSIEGLAATMQAVLDIHANYPQIKDLLQAKQPNESKRSIPEDFASLDHFKPELDYDGKVAKSCIHCHQVRDAARLEYRNAGEPVPLELLYPFPSPRVLGLELDTKTRATVASVKPDSTMQMAGVKAGDQIESVDGQVVSSEADFRWMLNNLDATRDSIALEVVRDEETKKISVPLPKGWRRSTDLSWRPTSWDLRRMATGGMTLIPLDKARRNNLDIADGKMALRAGHVGKYGHHARARKAGIRPNDVIVSFDGLDNLMTENALIEHAVNVRKPGDRVQIKYLRNGKLNTTQIKLQ